MILPPDQAAYLEALLPPRDALLREMEEDAREHDVPITVPPVGRLLEALARAADPGPILEVGTAIGYGALRMARAAPGSRVVAIDRDPEMLQRARGYLERGRVLDRVDLLEGEALDLLRRLSGPFALAYVDCEKSIYRRCLDLVLPHLAVGGMVVFDNLLWRGLVADPGEAEDETADALRSFNGYLMIHPQLAAVVLPLGDGVGLATKTRPLVTEVGGPF